MADLIFDRPARAMDRCAFEVDDVDRNDHTNVFEDFWELRLGVSQTDVQPAQH